MSPKVDGDPFVRVTWLDGPGGEGARWWNQAMDASRAGWLADPERRNILLKGLLWGGVAVGGIAYFKYLNSHDDDDGGGAIETVDAIDLQRQTSWDVGDVDRGFTVSDGATKDVADSDRWEMALAGGHLADLFAPPESRLRPFYSRTLFQAPDHAAGRSLHRYIAPIHNAAMDDAYDRGRALAEMFEAVGRPADTALVIDLPGPEAVALAAGLADLFSPVFTFDNWPHPRGVVPSHRTLDAALYYLPRFESAADKRGWVSPPAFVLDADRLAHYRDAVADFDNRYVVSLPSFEALTGLGVTHLMYVTASDPVQELDDLNGALAAYEVAGLSVRAVATADFQPDQDVALGRIGRIGRTAVPDAGVGPSVSRHYRYSGYHTGAHVHFWHDYGWYQTGPVAGVRRSVPAPIPAAPSRASTYRPAPRATMFANRAIGVGVAKPSMFGRITTRASSGGSSFYSGRSGSFGRGYSSFG
ncbi:MAG TPA: hypothetical protein VN903_19875 [Polyangia bacterium]|nr:hypothetical protein [Polyangia bacterium]